MPLTTQQMDDLQAKITSGDIDDFYSDLFTVHGDPYARLGLAVTNNDTWQGQIANGFAASAAAANSVDLSYGGTNLT